MVRYVIAVLAVSVLAVGTWAQNSTSNNPTDTVIDGAKNPELISDLTAYRLWLITVSALPNATPEEQAHQRTHLAPLNLTDLEYLQLVGLLADFKSQYQLLIERYNESVKATLASGGQTDPKLFLQQRDDLVQTTRAAITSRLSMETASRIEARVQEQKKHIQLHSGVHTMPGGNQ